MKRCLILALILAVAPAFAQDNKLDAELIKDRKTQNEALQKKIPKAGEGRVVPIGTVYMMSKDGFQVINPLAPAKYGSGAQNVTQNIYPDKTPGLANEYVNPLGGIILFGWAF